MSHVASASNTTGGSAGTSLAVTLSVSDGQRVIAFVYVGDFGSATVNTLPSGFTQIGSANTVVQNNGKDGVVYVYEKKVASSEPGSFTWGVSTSYDWSVSMHAFSGRHATTAATVQASSDTGNGTTPITATISGVTAVAGDDIVAFHGVSGSAYSGAWTGTPPTNYTERTETSSGSGAFGHYVSSRDGVSAGTTGSLAATMSNGAQTGEYFGFVVAIPQQGGGGAALFMAAHSRRRRN